MVSKQHKTSGLELVVVLNLGLRGFSFYGCNPPTHLHVLALQRLSGHKQRPDQVKEVGNRLKYSRIVLDEPTGGTND